MNSIKELIEQAIKFVGLSGIGWLLDMLVYTLLGMCSKEFFLNNLISSFVGVSFVFFTSTKLIFKNNSRVALKYKYLICLLYQVILIVFISKLLVIINANLTGLVAESALGSFQYIMAKIAVTPITMILNFIVMKNLIVRL